MAKKKIAKTKKAKKEVKYTPILENALPQNILLVGERVEEDKNIYIFQKVYKEIHKFTKNKTTNESGGMLIGTVLEEFGKTNIIINGFVEAKYCEATPTTLKFTHETWDYVHNEIEKKFPEQKIVGWIHTHPDFGIFLSEYDKFIQENFFREDYQIAYVVDPIQKIEGFYFWINEKLEKCKGFYKFDEMGVQIENGANAKEDDEEKPKSKFNLKNIAIAVLAACVIILAFSNSTQSSKIKDLENALIEMNNNIATTFYYERAEITALNSRISTLENALGINSEEEKSDDENKDDKSNEKSDKEDDNSSNSSNTQSGGN
jgi:proteasome lid subunit RPN8/RPN11